MSIEFLVTKLTNGKTKAWYKCGTLSKTDPITGDKRYVFSRSDVKFKIETCSHLLKWDIDAEYTWAIKYKSENSPSGYQNYNLIIGGNYAVFKFSDDFKTMYFKLPHWKEEICLN
ncbi:hypothetical protein [Chryseolinea sp. H1M3-3]|uniref:hypothetical protein n=1 Tax=Chryseolinea sp. H1M3-3 TaxID=3034144 RepID=UPI0023ED0DBA|nr:hypothetical protein [Chryseolinea sp. H1M3-3]